ncbi:MAG: FHA domain-containing protein [Anaerolineae bacterium]|nr:MAG: FHA domain-containing protein [Anaerolineae bacterium]
MSQFQFTLRKGPNAGKVYALVKNEIYVGRDISCDISINDTEVSRKHAHLVRVAEGYALEDLGSTNGTFINEVRINGQVMLQPGQMVRMGDNVVLAYEAAGFDPQATMASGRASYDPAPVQMPVQPSPQQMQPPTYQPYPATPPATYAGQIPDGPPMTGSLPTMGRPGINRRWLFVGCGVILFLGLCSLIGIFYYIDANFLWCDVFGGLIPTCP